MNFDNFEDYEKSVETAIIRKLREFDNCFQYFIQKKRVNINKLVYKEESISEIKENKDNDNDNDDKDNEDNAITTEPNIIKAYNLEELRHNRYNRTTSNYDPQYHDKKIFQEIEDSKSLVSMILETNFYENKKKKNKINLDEKRINKNTTCFNQRRIVYNNKDRNCNKNSDKKNDNDDEGYQINPNRFFKYTTEESIIKTDLIKNITQSLLAKIEKENQLYTRKTILINEEIDQDKLDKRRVSLKLNLIKENKGKNNDVVLKKHNKDFSNISNIVKADIMSKDEKNENHKKTFNNHVNSKIKEYQHYGYFKREINLDKMNKEEKVFNKGNKYNVDEIYEFIDKNNYLSNNINMETSIKIDNKEVNGYDSNVSSNHNSNINSKITTINKDYNTINIADNNKNFVNTNTINSNAIKISNIKNKTLFLPNKMNAMEKKEKTISEKLIPIINHVNKIGFKTKMIQEIEKSRTQFFVKIDRNKLLLKNKVKERNKID